MEERSCKISPQTKMAFTGFRFPRRSLVSTPRQTFFRCAIGTRSVLTFGARIELVFQIPAKIYLRSIINKGRTMQEKRLPNPTGRNNESIDPKLKQKKPYRPPNFTVLTPDQARLELTQRALPDDAAAQQLLARAIQLQKHRSNGQGSISRKAKAAPTP
jgi:hypothetical protein